MLAMMTSCGASVQAVCPTLFVEKSVKKEYNQNRMRFQRVIDELGG